MIKIRNMKFHKLKLAGAYVVELEPLEDSRGFFARAFCENEFAAAGIPFKVSQMNISSNRHKGTLRGLHYQLGDAAEDKFVRCIRGGIVDVIVDVRPGSATFLEHEMVELDERNRKAILLPKGFAHGIQTLSDESQVLYLASAPYAPKFERGLRWNDPRLGIRWPLEPAVISEKDQALPDFDPAYHLK